MLLFENNIIKIEVENSEIPWIKIFTNKKIKEFSQCDERTKKEIWKYLDIIEKEMLNYFKPTKINIASFGNYVPHVHFHIMCRFENDSFFPEPVWGKKQRESTLNLPSLEIFFKYLKEKF